MEVGVPQKMKVGGRRKIELENGKEAGDGGGITSRNRMLQTSGTGEGLGLTGRDRRGGKLRQTDTDRAVMSLRR